MIITDKQYIKFNTCEFENALSEFTGTSITRVYHHIPTSKKPLYLGILITSVGSIALTVAVLSTLHLIPGINISITYTLLTGGSIAILMGISIGIIDRVKAWKKERKYKILAHKNLYQIQNDQSVQWDSGLLRAFKTIDQYSSSKDSDIDAHRRLCHIYTASNPSTEVVLLKNKEKMILHIFFYSTPLQGKTAGEIFLDQAQIPTCLKSNKSIYHRINDLESLN